MIPNYLPERPKTWRKGKTCKFLQSILGFM